MIHGRGYRPSAMMRGCPPSGVQAWKCRSAVVRPGRPPALAIAPPRKNVAEEERVGFEIEGLRILIQLSVAGLHACLIPETFS